MFHGLSDGRTWPDRCRSHHARRGVPQSRCRQLAAFVGAGPRSLALFERSEWATEGRRRRSAASAFVGEARAERLPRPSNSPRMTKETAHPFCGRAVLTLLLLQSGRRPYNPGMNTNASPLDNAAEHGVAASQHCGCPPPSSEESRRRWAAWHQAMELSHAMLMMGLRQKVGPEGDLRSAYRDWYQRYQALKWDTNRAS